MTTTNEYCLPISYGLEEYLPKLGCNPCTVYLKAHFNKIFKGEQKGVVIFKLVEWAKFFGVSKPTIFAQLKILEEIKFIEWIVKSNNRHTPNRIRILKDKTMSDFTVLQNKKLPLKKLNGKRNKQALENTDKKDSYRKETLTVEESTVKNPERCLYGNSCNLVINNEIQTPKDVKGCIGCKKILLVVFNHWNNQKKISMKMTSHREPKKFIPHIKARLEHYTPAEIVETINNYATILGDNKKYKLTYRWTLDRFLTTRGVLDRFLTTNDPFTYYLKSNNQGGSPDDRFKSIGKSI